MKEMIKNYRGTLISSGLVILVGILVGFTSILHIPQKQSTRSA